MRVFLCLRPVRSRLLFAAVIFDFLGVACAAAGWFSLATLPLLTATASSALAIRIFESSEQEPKTRGIHASFPIFVRLAYGWPVIAASLGVAACRWDTSGGFWGASRHALTVGFVGVMILAVGPRILPAFAGMRLLLDPRMLFSCFLRDTRVPGLCGRMGLARFACFCVDRVDGALNLCGQHDVHLHAADEPRRE